MSFKRILILGAAGMLGHTLFTELSKKHDLNVYGTVRNLSGLEKILRPEGLQRIRAGVDAENFDTIIRSMASIQPDIIINCIGLIKQSPIANDPLSAITVNAQLPHRISLVCRNAGARMIHISTDCVFDGQKGQYTEEDVSNARDLYGRTKFLGEVSYSHCVTLRTSIIGHELKSKLGLTEWFLDQSSSVNGYTRAIYTGVPTVELAEIISRYVITNDDLSGLYHVSSPPISKFDLLKLIASRYGKKIEIEPFNDFFCDRSLDSSLFREKSGYVSPAWPALIDKMYDHYERSGFYKS